MTKHWKRSRVTKALTDAGRATSFSEAEDRLDAIRVAITVGDDQIATPAGQAAVLTAVATAHKCFGRVSLIATRDAPLIASLPLGRSLLKAARRLGAATGKSTKTATHVIRIGAGARSTAWDIRCWWDRWLSGTRAFDGGELGDSRLAIAGVFAGAAAVRQIFACVLAAQNIRERDVSVSLWEPWNHADLNHNGPKRFDVPDKLWLLGLGHLGQAFAWTLCFVPGTSDRLVVLQDDQFVREENEATSLLVLPGDGEMGKRKTRIVSPWFEAAGWRTQLIERRHLGDISITDADPPFLLSGLDRLEPRRVLARHGFPFMLDAGIGHGHADFEGIQLRTIAKGQPLERLWEADDDESSADREKKLLERPAYAKLDQCGKVSFAEASVAVPFVGAATGALAVAQVIRLASMHATPLLLQIQLGAPDMPSFGGLAAAPEYNLGSFSVRL
jgi:hypothetical protein